MYRVPELQNAGGRYQRRSHRILITDAWLDMRARNPDLFQGFVRHEMLHAHGVNGHPKDIVYWQCWNLLFGWHD